MTWERLEEQHIYTGATEDEAAAKCRAGMDEALREGYLAERLEWAPDSLSVTVTYEYDPARAGRPV